MSLKDTIVHTLAFAKILCAVIISVVFCFGILFCMGAVRSVFAEHTTALLMSGFTLCLAAYYGLKHLVKCIIYEIMNF